MKIVYHIFHIILKTLPNKICLRKLISIVEPTFIKSNVKS